MRNRFFPGGCAMKWGPVLLAVVGLLIPGAARAADAQKELAQLEGTWVTVSKETMGKKASEEEIKKLNTKLVIKGDKLTVFSTEGGKDEVLSELTIKLDPTTKPKSLDAT